MSSKLTPLLIIQDRDRKILKLTKEATDIPARRDLVKTRLEEHRAALEAAQEELKKQGLAIKELEGEIEAAKQKLLKFKDQQRLVKTNVEYRALQQEIHNTEKEIRDIEDRELALMEGVEIAQAEVHSREARLKEEETQVQQDIQTLEQRAARIEEEIAGLREEREGLVADADPHWLARYDRIFQHLQDAAIVPVEHGACGGCFMKLTPQTVHNVRGGQSLVLCEYCGRILYSKQ